MGAFYSKTEWKEPLKKAFENAPLDAINHYILLSSGKDLQERKNYLFLQNYLNTGEENSFYSVGLSSDEGLATLDFFSSSNRGKIFSAQTNRGIKRNLLKLVKSLSAPIAKNVTPTIYGEKNANMQVYRQIQNPYLFADQPYVVFGVTKEKKDFLLFLQGIGAENYFHIKKKVSFDDAKRGGQELLRKWALLQSYEHYQNYFSDLKNEHIQNAHQKLAPFSLKNAF